MPVVPEALLQTPRFPQACLSEVGTSVLCSSLEQLHDPRIDLAQEIKTRVLLSRFLKQQRKKNANTSVFISKRQT